MLARWLMLVVVVALVNNAIQVSDFDAGSDDSMQVDDAGMDVPVVLAAPIEIRAPRQLAKLSFPPPESGTSRLHVQTLLRPPQSTS